MGFRLLLNSLWSQGPRLQLLLRNCHHGNGELTWAHVTGTLSSLWNGATDCRLLGRHAIYVCRGVPSGVCYTAHVCNSIRKSRPTGTYISSQLCNTHMHTLDKHNHCMTALLWDKIMGFDSCRLMEVYSTLNSSGHVCEWLESLAAHQAEL